MCGADVGTLLALFKVKEKPTKKNKK